jgi:CelD/BcsL family acetyltransferase involved in cellulose biosynthesis
VLETEIISEIEQFADMREEWNALLSKSNTNTIFLTWEWLYSWWECFGGGKSLHIISVRNNENKLVGLAPLFIWKTAYYKLPSRQLTFIGTGHSDREDFIISKEADSTQDTILGTIMKNSRLWDLMSLDQIPDTSKLLKFDSASLKGLETEQSSACPYVEVTGDWDAFFGSLSKKFKRDIRNKTNRLKRFGNWKFRVEKIKDFSACIDIMSDIEKSSRKEKTEKEFMGVKENREFLEKFAEKCLPLEWIDFSTITVEGMPIAYLLCFRYGGKVYAYNMSYNNEFYQASPGKLILNEKLRWCFSMGFEVGEFDLLRGETYIKSLWTRDARQHTRIMLFNCSIYSRLLRMAGFKVRPMAKNRLGNISTLFKKEK